MIENVVRVARTVKEWKCPICGCEKLWFKEIRRKDTMQPSKVHIIYKCDNCAYVNNMRPVETESVWDAPYSSYEYSLLGKHIILPDTVTDGTSKMIGLDYWFDGDRLKRREVGCWCGSTAKVNAVNPFIRRHGEYRVDVICKCEKSHVLAFGVHVPPSMIERVVAEVVG